MLEEPFKAPRGVGEREKGGHVQQRSESLPREAHPSESYRRATPLFLERSPGEENAATTGEESTKGGTETHQMSGPSFRKEDSVSPLKPGGNLAKRGRGAQWKSKKNEGRKEDRRPNGRYSRWGRKLHEDEASEIRAIG